ncbi:BspA family leucine-rich repeat surface protein, partial [Companilactobacillus jidongensis]|uniref:BspA family leucine-rich repeat surface protein n=1 Tax=Companilactobacillus jidongensis TaxID=2486006 RepID=UPI000F7B1D43
MRFQQLKRDPNAVMRKKLVKSKKNWIVVSSLSIAGGLFLLGGPSTVAKADVATASVKTESVTPSATTPSSTGTTEGTTPAADTSGKTTDTTTTPSVEDSTTAPTADSTKDTTPDTPVETTTPEKDNAVVETPAEEPASDTTTDSTTVKPAAFLAAAPTALADETTTPTDGEDTTAKAAETPVADPTTTGADGSTVTGDTTTTDPTKIVSEEKTLDADASTVEALDAVAPVAEDAAVTTDSGTGWTYDSTNTTLNITGALTDYKGGDTEHWGGNTSAITTVNISTPIVAPADSSYMFANMTNLTSFNNDTLSNLDTSAVTNAEGMFKNDKNISIIDLSGNDVSKAENISHMFENDDLLTTIKFSDTGLKNIVNGSYAFANDPLLSSFTKPNTDISSMNSWNAYNATDLKAMFKNDVSLGDINLGTWSWTKGTGSTNGSRNPAEWPNTGDSSIGEGMFDGTNLNSITLNSYLSFSPGTALTSDSGSTWSNSTYNASFSGIPQFNGTTLVSGIAKLYIGTGIITTLDGSTINGVTDVKQRMFAYTPSGAVQNGQTATNQVTIHTTQGDIVVIQDGLVGTTDPVQTVNVPSTWTFNGVPYFRTSADTANVVYGQTKSTADGIADFESVKASGKTGMSIPTNKTGQSVTIDIPDYYEGGTQTITLTDDNLPSGYTFADGSDKTVTVKYNGDTATNPYTLSPDEIELVGEDVPTDATINNPSATNNAGNNVDTTVTVPEGTVIGTPTDVTVSAPGYKDATVKAIVSKDADGNYSVTYTNPDGTTNSSTNAVALTGEDVPTDATINPVVTDQAGKNVDVSV